MEVEAIATADAAPTVYCHLDILAPHLGGKALGCIAGWLAAAAGFEVVAVGLRINETTCVRCNFPFHRGDQRGIIALGGREALTGFNLLVPRRLDFSPARLVFEVLIAAEDAPTRAFRFSVDSTTGTTRRIDLTKADALPEIPDFTALSAGELGPLLEERTLDHLASRRKLWLRLDLINKCNLRCVMCHYSNEEFSRRPVQRIVPEQFFSFYEPLAPIVREVVLSCGDEPLMSPYFETIIREIAVRDPEVKIRFCTNAMLLSRKIADGIIAANVHLIMFSFDGVTSETLHRIRVGSDYRRIIKNILHLRSLRKARGRPRPLFVFNYVMLDSNIHEAPLFVRMARRLGADYIDFRHVVPYEHYDIEHEMLEYDQPKYNHYRQQIAAAAAAEGIDVFLPPPFASEGRHDPSGDPVCTLDEFHEVLRALGEEPHETLPAAHAPEEESSGPIPESAHFFCDRPFTEVMIRDQNVYPCPWHREKLGTIDGTTSLEEIFFGEKFRRLRLAMLNPEGAPGCKGCPIKGNYLPIRTAPTSAASTV